LKTTQTFYLRLQALSGIIIHYDEILTMSARMGAATGSLEWEERYRKYEPLLDATIKETIELSPEIFMSQAATETDASNIELVAMENQAFDLIRQGQRKAAMAILFSKEYERHKVIYSKGMEKINSTIQERINSTLKTQRQRAFLIATFAMVTLIILLLAWFGIVRLVVIYVDERKKAEEDLKKAHNELEKKVEDRTANLQLANEQLKQEITQRKETEKELRESEERYQKLIETANDAIFIADAETGIILNANRKAGELLGIPPEKIIGMHQKEMHAKEDKTYYRKLFLDNAQKEGGIILDNIFVWHKNGFRVPVEISSSAIKVGGKFVMQGIFRDMTEHKKAEEKLLHNQEQLRSLASQLTKAEEQERRNIASYLHDHLGQELFAMKLQLEQLKQSFPASHTIKDIESIIERTNQMMSDMRSMSYELSPPILYELGFEAALEWIAEGMRTLNAINITFNDDGQIKTLDETTKVLIFQAVRELLNNITRHAKAQNVEIFVARDNAMVVIQVNDDGIGFESSKVDQSREKTQGFGLYSIRERLKYIGGNLDVESALNRGTRITLKAPLES
jgi:PAS domain S-box-containing protein